MPERELLAAKVAAVLPANGTDLVGAAPASVTLSGSIQ